jgi:hypothetical protein
MKLSVTFLTLFSLSCSSKVEAVFEIKNSTNQGIQNLTIKPDAYENNHISIEPHSKAILKTDMTNLPKVDGSYYLSFQSNDKFRELYFGYYSNGYPSESITRIDIHFDTIIIKQEFKKPY